MLKRNFLMTGSALVLAVPATLMLASAAWSDEVDPPRAIDALEWQFRDDTTILVYGQINKGILTFDDGGRSTTYGLTDNDNSSTRAGVKSTTDFDSGWQLFSNIEIDYQPHASNVVSQLDKNASDYSFTNANIRKIEVAMFSEKYGRFWLGQGSMASDDTAKAEKSGTRVITYSDISDMAGGSLFRLANGDLSDVSINDSFSNYDGLGRKVRIRYDTPDFNGFRLKTSYGQDLLTSDNPKDLYDVAATYDGEFNDIAIAGAMGYGRDTGADADIFSASASGLHTPTGLSLTLAGGQRSADITGSYGYVKLGWETDFFDWGNSAFSVDYYDGSKINNSSSSSKAYSIAGVQDIDYWDTELWLAFRNHEYDDDLGDYQDGLAVFGGARIKF